MVGSGSNDEGSRSEGARESASPPSIDEVGAAVLQITRELVVELHPKLVDPRLVRLDSDLDRDLALDSLSRAELLLRLDRRFKVQISESLIGEADCPNDLVTAILAAGPAIAETARGSRSVTPRPRGGGRA